MRSQGSTLLRYCARLLAGCVCLSFLVGPAAIAGRRPVPTPAPPPKAKGAKKPAAKPAPKAAPRRPETPAQRKIREAAEKRRLARLRQARAKALPYWQRLIRDYPHSRFLPDALYNAGVLLIDAGKYTEAAKHLGAFIDKYPHHPLVGFAALALIDLDLERLFDLKSASKHADAGIAWVKKQQQAKQAGSGKTGPRGHKSRPVDWVEITRKACIPTDSTSAGGIFRQLAYDLCFRAGLAAYLAGEPERAQKMIGMAGGFETRERRAQYPVMPTRRMMDVLYKRQKPITPEKLLARINRESQKTGVLLADLYLLCFHPHKASRIFERMLRAVPPFPQPSPALESYLLLRMGQALEYQGRRSEAKGYLERLYAAKYSGYRWAADGILRLGTWTHNARQRAPEAMKHWEHVFRTSPNHPEAHRALFYYGITSMRMGDYRKAITAFEEYLRRYPKSRWSSRVLTELLPEARQRQKKESKL